MTEKNFFYDEFSDRLMISCKKPNDKIIGSVRLLNATFDFTTDNRIVNVEIRNASDYISSLGLEANFLENLSEAKLMCKQYRDGYVIYFILKPFQGEIQRIPFNIPMNSALVTA